LKRNKAHRECLGRLIAELRTARRPRALS
jgi:hypothetical protein